MTFLHVLILTIMRNQANKRYDAYSICIRNDEIFNASIYSQPFTNLIKLRTYM